MNRGGLIGLGVVALLVGLVLVGIGATAAVLVGPDDSLSTRPARLSGSGVALVVEDITVDAGSIPVPKSLGVLTLAVSSPERRPMFAGTATADAIDGYLAGAPYDVVIDLRPGGDGLTRPVPGTQAPPTPASQPLWLAQSVGSPAELTATIAPDATLVVMNADATPGVVADLVVTLTVARAWSAAWIAVGVGVVLLALSAVAFWRASVVGARRDPPPRHAAGATTAATVLPGADASPSIKVAPATDVVAEPADPPEASAYGAEPSDRGTDESPTAAEPGSPGSDG